MTRRQHDIRDELKAAIQASGLSAGDLERLCGVSQPQITRFLLALGCISQLLSPHPLQLVHQVGIRTDAVHLVDLNDRRRRREVHFG